MFWAEALYLLTPSACGTLAARQSPPALARRGLTMRCGPAR
jgi:hypothetical protein